METELANQELAPLPFTYEQTYDQKKAVYEQWRISPVTIKGQENKPRKDQDIIQMVRKERESKDWFLTEYWRKKGQPNEQVEFTIDNSPITLYNWNEEQPFTERHIEEAKKALQELGSRFPQILNNLRWILIEDHQEPSLLGDPNKYPANGNSWSRWKTFRLFPRGMSFEPHRIQKASNFEGTLTHELTHLIVDGFRKEWNEKFKWELCDSYPNEWELKESPDGKKKVYFHKNTGEMAPQWRFPLQPEQCINYYAKQNTDEDICESMVAYIYDSELLEKASQDKLDILQKHDAKKPKPEVIAQRVAKDQIKLPEIRPETVYYFIKEPQS
ncbi:MAG: hypothetical protein HYT07_03735 [Candidatus Levybacteria bacterium]|nr:hypothetical protein [Candidatus Levybacteria bacterium]